MKKQFAFIVVSMVLVPSFAFAAWWNPFTWKISSWLPWVKKTSTVQIEKNIATSTQTSTTDSMILKLQEDLEKEKTARLKLQEQITSGSQNKAKSTSAINNTPSNTKTTKNFTTPSGAVIDESGTVIVAPKTESPAIQITGQTVLTTKQIAALVSPSVALITTSNGSGSGFVINGGKYILTNAHVIGNDSFVQISLPSMTFTAPVLGKNTNVDLAIIYSGNNQPPAVILGSSDANSLSVGDDVYALGFPFSASVGLINLTLTKGVLSSRQIVDGQTLLQTDASINPGNSGGPLIDNTGEVIGINTSRLNDAFKAQGIGFAIPIDTVKSYIPILSQYGQSRYEVYPIGKTFTILRSLETQIDINPKLSCSQLGLKDTDLTLCGLYRNYHDDYKWLVQEDPH